MEEDMIITQTPFRMSFFGGGTDFPDKKRLMINLNNPLIESLADMDKEKAEMVINQIYDLARMESEPLGAEDLEKFIKRSVEMLGMIK